ncbi:hypothetical protein ElyMa_003472700 [Elysia marginata]|uniref:MYND-type domain-containing protein n=1 Tax=Elysia marginata TaxID=1093978 RepID=A0AAV4EB75_9GAST|nr:hypothetical protein ElyMa_003472700 [Elysia marginata]
MSQIEVETCDQQPEDTESTDVVCRQETEQSTEDESSVIPVEDVGETPDHLRDIASKEALMDTSLQPKALANNKTPCLPFLVFEAGTPGPHNPTSLGNTTGSVTTGLLQTCSASFPIGIPGQELVETNKNDLAIGCCENPEDPIKSMCETEVSRESPSRALDFSCSAASAPSVCTVFSVNRQTNDTETCVTASDALSVACVSGGSNLKTDVETSDQKQNKSLPEMATRAASPHNNELRQGIKSSRREVVLATSGNLTKVSDLRQEVTSSSLEKVADFIAQNEASPLDLCVKKTECSTSGSGVSRTRGPLPVQMVLPQVQAQRSPLSPSSAVVAIPGSNVVMSPPAHSKSLHQMSGLSFGMEGQYYPLSHHQYRGLHPSLIDLKVPSPSELANFETTPPGDSEHSIDAFTERHQYESRIHEGGGLAIRESQGAVPTVYIPDTDNPIEGNGMSSHGPDIAQLTTNHKPTRPSVVIGKVSKSSNFQRYQVVSSEPAAPKVLSLGISTIGGANSLCATKTETAGSGSVNSPGTTSISDGFVGVTSPYHVSTSSALAMSDAELDQEFQQHLLEFKALEKLAERKAREQMQVAIMRKRKAEMLRVMEIKKARREMMQKGKKLGQKPDNELDSRDSRDLGQSVDASSSNSINRQLDVTVHQAAHAGSLSASSAASLIPISGKHESSAMLGLVPNTAGLNVSYLTSRTQTTSSVRASGRESLFSSMRTNREVTKREENTFGRDLIAPITGFCKKDISTISTNDLVPLNLSAEKGNFAESASVPGDKCSQVSNIPPSDSASSPCVAHPLPAAVSIPTALTTTLTTAITSSVHVIAASSGSLSSSSSKETITENTKLETASPSAAISANTSVSVSGGSSISVSIASQPEVPLSLAQTKSSVSTNSLITSKMSSTAQTVAESVQKCVSSSISPSVITDPTTVSSSHATSCEPAASEGEHSVSLHVTTDSYTLELKREIMEDNRTELKTTPSPSSFTAMDSSTSDDPKSQTKSEFMGSAEVKKEIIEEDPTSPCGGISGTGFDSEQTKEDDKNGNATENDENSEALMDGECGFTSSDKELEKTINDETKPKASPVEESRKMNERGHDEPHIINMVDVKVETPDDDASCPELENIKVGEKNDYEKVPAISEIDIKGNDIIGSSKEAKDTLPDLKPVEMLHDTDLSVDSGRIPELKPEVETIEIEKTLVPITRSEKRPRSPVTAHQAPTDTGPVDFDPDFPGDFQIRTSHVAGAYHRREEAVLEPPFQVSAENGGKSSTESARRLGSESSPLPAHNQKPFQAAGSLIVPGNGDNSAPSTPLPSTPSPSCKVPRSNANAFLSVNSALNNSLETPKSHVNSTLIPPSGQTTTNKNSAPSLRARELKPRLPVMRRRSLDLAEPLTSYKGQSAHILDRSQEMNLGYRPAVSAHNPMGLPVSLSSFAPSGESVHLPVSRPSQQLQNHIPTNSLQTFHQDNRLNDSFPPISDMSNRTVPHSSTPDEVKSSAGSKRSAFKSLVRKRSRDASALDLSVHIESTPPIKSALYSGHSYPAGFSVYRSRVPPQDGLVTDSISMQEKLYQQGRRSDSGMNFGMHYPSRQPKLSDSTHASFTSQSSPNIAPHIHPVDIPTSPSKRLSGTFDTDRARPGGFLTIRSRNLTRDAALGVTGMHLFTTETDSMPAGNVAPLPKLQEHVRPSMSSVAQHRLRYQKTEGTLPTADQPPAPPMIMTDPAASAGMIFPKGSGYDVQNEISGFGLHKVTPLRPSPHIPGDLVYGGVQQRTQDVSNQPQTYQYQLPSSDPISEKHQTPAHSAVDYRATRVGPSTMSVEAEASLHRQREIMLKKQKQDYQHQQGAPLPPGYFVNVTPARQGMLPGAYMLASKQGVSPGSMNPISGHVGTDQRDQRPGGGSGARQPGFRSQLQSAQNSYAARSQVPNQQQLQHQQLQQEKQRCQQSEQQQVHHFSSGDNGLVRPGPHSQHQQQQQQFKHSEGAHVLGASLQTGSSYGSLHTAPSYMHAYHDTHQNRHQQQHQPQHHLPQQQQQQQQQMSLRNGTRGPSPHQKNTMTTPPSQSSVNHRLGYMHTMHGNHSLAPPQLAHGDLARQQGYHRMHASGSGPNTSHGRALGGISQGPLAMLQNSIHNPTLGMASTDMHQPRYQRKQPMCDQRLTPPLSSQYPQHLHQHQQQQQQRQHQQQQQQPLPAQGTASLPPHHYQNQGVQPHQLQTGMRATGSGIGGNEQSGTAAVPSRGQVVGNNVCHVCGKMALFLCSSCRQVWYCNHQCQTRHWAIHAPNCKAEAKSQSSGL